MQLDKKYNFSDKSINKLEIWKRLYQNRDFELLNLWDKSKFIFAILTLLYGAIGYLFLQFYDKKFSYFTDIFWLYLAEIFLLGFAGLFSLLWIKLAKGSKFYYEVYEFQIDKFEIENYIITHNVFNDMTEFKQNIDKYNEIKYKKLIDTYKNKKQSKCLFLPNAYRYSPSEINIFIGYYSFIAVCIMIIFIFFEYIFNELYLLMSVIFG